MKLFHVLLAGVAIATAAVAHAQAPAVAASGKAVTFITLGTGGGPVIRRERSQPANALVVGDAVYLFDAGSGVERQLVRAGLTLDKLRAIIISHHHIDHDADLGQLMSSRWMFNHLWPIPIIGPPGTVEQVLALTAANRVVEMAPIGAPGLREKPALGSTVAPRDMAAAMDSPAEVYKDENINVLAITNAHYHFPPDSAMATFSRSYSFRIEAYGRTIVYTGDTGPSENVVRLARGVDMLVSEVVDVEKMRAILHAAPDLPAAMLPSMVRHMEDDHLTPIEVGKLARAAGVKEVVLTHIVPGMDGEADLSGYMKGVGKAFTGSVRLAKDLERF